MTFILIILFLAALSGFSLDVARARYQIVKGLFQKKP